MSKYVIDSTTLVAIGDAVREKEGTTAPIAVNQLATRISAIETGGGEGGYEIPENAFKLTGDCSYKFAYNSWNWFIETHGKKITSSNMTTASYMFYESDLLEDLSSLTLTFNKSQVNSTMYMFSYSGVQKLPKIDNLRVYAQRNMFESNKCLRDIPQDFCDTWDWSYLNNTTSAYDGSKQYMFQNCSALRSYPNALLANGNPQAGYSSSQYYYCFNNCYSLDEVVDFPYPHYKAKWTSNAFNGTFAQCSRLKNLTFALQEDGTPYQMNWKSQNITLSGGVGYANGSSPKSEITRASKYTGITADKEVTDDASYQALKDNPDWWTSKIEYSRYNHDSAVATINTLPDTTISGGTNTIQFDGAAGSLTDGGAINTLTEAEIAVATAKGWTVTLK